MSKNNIIDDDLIHSDPANLAKYGSTGDMMMFDDYEELDVTKAKEDIELHAVKIIKGIAELYFENGLIGENSYIDSIKQIETMSLNSMLIQVKYANHAIETLMRQLDSGGYMLGLEIYDTIIKLQQNSMDVTKKVSEYCRTLPEYFNSLVDDVNNAKPSIEILGNSVESELDLSNEEATKNSTELTQPIRDSKKMIEQLHSISKEMIKIETTSSDFMDNPINVVKNDLDYEENDIPID